MDEIPVTSRAPKRALTGLITSHFAAEEIRTHFHIGADTAIESRLPDFTKAELLALIASKPVAMAAFHELERLYPLSGTATLYIVLADPRRALRELADRANMLAEAERDGGVYFDERRAVRVVYVAGPAVYCGADGVMLEVPVKYERRLEYCAGDPASEDYGRQQTLYTLENGYLWLVERGRYGIVCSPDYEAVRPILQLAGRQLGVSAHMLNLDEQTLLDLARDANPSSATFQGPPGLEGDILDARTISLYDPQLAGKRGYRSLLESPARHQTAGFYRDHPGLAAGGLGIASRYGRVWTPLRLSRTRLEGLALDLIGRTRTKFEEQRHTQPSLWVSHHRHVPAEVGGRRLGGRDRDAFDALVATYAAAGVNERRQARLKPGHRRLLVQSRSAISLFIGYEIACPNCGPGLARCPECAVPYMPVSSSEELLPQCPQCGTLVPAEAEALTCICGEAVQIPDLAQALWMYPEPSLLSAIWDFVDGIHEPLPRLTFYINGDLLTAVPTHPPNLPGRLELGDLRLWRNTARIHHRNRIGDQRRQILISILAKTKEKCSVNGYHPREEHCNTCFGRDIDVELVRSGSLCLPRILGLAIGRNFDGIHHGQENADIRYEDVYDEEDRSVELGIHLKSRTRSRARGLGRSVSEIKGLYTQLFYSVYKVVTGQLDFAAVGVSVPNTIQDEVVMSMQTLVNDLGLPLLVIDEDGWVKVMDAAMESVLFNDARV